jgi:diguanylate cyclase (GGDEF)-like protein/PAS domain S-box-containing protein
VASGFAALLVLMLLLTVFGVAYMSAAERRVEQIANVHMERLDLATRMHQAARERTVNLQKMVLLTDPFERDEQWLQFNERAGEFAAARGRLLGMDLSAAERELLDRQSKLTGVVLPLQERVIELVSQGRVREAQTLLAEKAIPAQDAVLEQLSRLYALEKKLTDGAVVAAQRANQQARGLLIAFSLVIVVLGLVIAVAVLRHTRRADAALHQEKERALATLHSMGDGVIRTDATGRVEYLNPVAERLTGWTTDDALGRRVAEVFAIVHDITRTPAQNPVTRALAARERVSDSSDIVLTGRGGREYAIEFAATPTRGPVGEVLGAVLVFRDVTEVRALGRELAHQATHDALTGLFNRRAFEEKLQQAIERSHTSGAQHALCHLDLDLFRMVNDSCGHAAGDEMLRQVGQLLKARLPPGSSIARPAGDRFLLLLEDCPFEEAGVLADALRQAIREFRFVWDKREFSAAASLGVVRIAADIGSLYDAMQSADVACRVAKDEGRNRVHLYQRNDLTILRRQREIGWVQRLNQAMRENRFTLYCQAVQPLKNRRKRATHYEILVRLTDETGHVVSPAAFLPAAERYHLMPQLDRWVVRETLERLGELNWESLSGAGSFNINLSGQSLYEPEFQPFLLERIRESGVPAGHLCFEITETAAVTNLASAMRLIAALKGAGCRFALDDFGSGLSSFAYLKSMRVDYLKIDGTFVRNLPDDTSDIAMVNSINQVAHAMGIETIAEYAENDAIRAALVKLGVDYAQGYALAVPRPLTQVLKEIQDLNQYARQPRR